MKSEALYKVKYAFQLDVGLMPVISALQRQEGQERQRLALAACDLLPKQNKNKNKTINI